MTITRSWLIAAAGVVAGAVGALAVIFSPVGDIDRRVEAAVEARLAVIADRPVAELGPQIEAYLLANPSVLERVSAALNEERAAAQRLKSRAQIDENREAIFGEAGAAVVGNPSGDVTLVELYDYNCGYCRSAFPDVVALLDEDPQLKLVLRQFPILSQGSVDAAKVGTLVAAEAGVDYFAFHQAMFTSRGQVDLEAALAAAGKLGLDPVALRARLEAPEAQSSISVSFSLAQKLGISGTPTFILGDEIIPGAVGIDVLRTKIANVRKCGSTACS